MSDEKYHRCSICNSTNSMAIATELEDYSPNAYFLIDPLNPLDVICDSCHQSIVDSLHELGENDE